MDCLVTDMIKRGPFNVQRPAELSKIHFEQLRSILAKVIDMYTLTGISRLGSRDPGLWTALPWSSCSNAAISKLPRVISL